MDSEFFWHFSCFNFLNIHLGNCDGDVIKDKKSFIKTLKISW